MRANTIPLNCTIKQDFQEGWSSYMATVFFGMCHTFKYPLKIQADQGASYNSSLFYLDPSLNYRIMIHDPKFYHVLVKHSVFPRVWLEYKAVWSTFIG